MHIRSEKGAFMRTNVKSKRDTRQSAGQAAKRRDTGKTVGIIAVILSAIIFGIAPTIVTLTFSGGNSGMNAAFLRSLIILPGIYTAVLIKKIPLKVSRAELKDLILCIGVGQGITSVLLSGSYDFIPVSVATPVHFVYPVAAAVLGRMLWREKLNKAKLLALALCAAGVVCFFEKDGAIAWQGIAMALISGFTFAFYLQYLGRSSLAEMPLLKLLFYTNLISCAVAGIVCAACRSITFSLTAGAWANMILASLMISVTGTVLLQFGTRIIGGLTSAICSTFEPIFSVLCGVIVLGESVSTIKLLGSVLILLSILCITLLSKEG